MKVSFICPFSLDRPTGTPSRARTTIRSASGFTETSVVTLLMSSVPEGITVKSVGICGLIPFTRRALRELQVIHPDILHGITTASIPTLFLYKWLVHPRAKIIFEMHGWAWFEMRGTGRFFLRMTFLLLDLLGLQVADVIIVMSHTQKAFVSRWTFNSGRILVLWGPVDSLPSFIPASPEGPLVVGYLGNSSWWQGLHYLLNATILLKDDPSFEFWFAGFEASDLESIPRIPSIHYKGILKDSEVLPFLRGCHVLVSPRVLEPVSNLQFPHKLSGYLSAGRPVVVSATNDQPRIIAEARCGFVIDPLNAESLVHALKKFSQLPREEQQKMGERSSLFAREHFSPEILTTTLKELYVIE